ncbi:MAG: DUF3899 domain-containing protein [Clostridia bacterium]|nr:DUF3899 domain-containing protein [Clostridia bacterium]
MTTQTPPEKKPHSLKSYISCAVFMLALVVIFAFYKDLWGQSSPKEVMRILSDGFVVASAIVGGVGGLMWIAGFGQFDGIAYSFKTIGARLTLREYDKDGHRLLPSFYDYRAKKDEKRSKKINPLVICGLIGLTVGFILMGVYAML